MVDDCGSESATESDEYLYKYVVDFLENNRIR